MRLYEIYISKKDNAMLKIEVENAIVLYTNNLREQSEKEHFNVRLHSIHNLINSLTKILDVEKNKSDISSLYLTLDELSTIIFMLSRDKITDSRAKKQKMQHILDFLKSKFEDILDDSNDNDEDWLNYLIKNRTDFILL